MKRKKLALGVVGILIQTSLLSTKLCADESSGWGNSPYSTSSLRGEVFPSAPSESSRKRGRKEGTSPTQTPRTPQEMERSTRASVRVSNAAELDKYGRSHMHRVVRAGFTPYVTRQVDRFAALGSGALYKVLKVRDREGTPVLHFAIQYACLPLITQVFTTMESTPLKKLLRKENSQGESCLALAERKVAEKLGDDSQLSQLYRQRREEILALIITALAKE